MPPREINFDVGEPDFHTPDEVKQAAHRAIEDNYTRYTPQPGFLDLREAIAAKFQRDNGFSVSPDRIVVSCGAKHSLYNVFQAVLEPGDEVIVFRPHWYAYPHQVELARGRPVFVPLREDRRFQPDGDDLLSAVGSRTRMIVMNTPSNPTGAVYDRDTLVRIAEIACRRDLTVVSDEVYESIVYDGCRHVSIASLGADIASRTVTVNGVSKTYAMTGWRIGYAAMPASLAERVIRLQSLSTSGPSAVSQRAALAALAGDQGCVARMAAEYQRRRDLVVARINGIPGLSCRPPRGAFYAFVRITGILGTAPCGVPIDSSRAFADLLLAQARVRLHPGADFGSDAHVRISFATSLENLEEGLERISSLLSRGHP